MHRPAETVAFRPTPAVIVNPSMTPAVYIAEMSRRSSAAE
jgi:hypothetical protein